MSRAESAHLRRSMQREFPTDARRAGPALGGPGRLAGAFEPAVGVDVVISDDPLGRARLFDASVGDALICRGSSEPMAASLRELRARYGEAIRVSFRHDGQHRPFITLLTSGEVVRCAA
jgi:hypothetical protein